MITSKNLPKYLDAMSSRMLTHETNDTSRDALFELLGRMILPRPALSYDAENLETLQADAELTELRLRVKEIESRQMVEDFIMTAGDQIDIGSFMYQTFMVAANVFVIGPAIEAVGGVIRQAMQTKGVGLLDDVTVEKGKIKSKNTYFNPLVNDLSCKGKPRYITLGEQLMKEQLDEMVKVAINTSLGELNDKLSQKKVSEKNKLEALDGNQRNVFVENNELDFITLSNTFKSRYEALLDGRNLDGKLLILQICEDQQLTITPRVLTSLYHAFWTEINSQLTEEIASLKQFIRNKLKQYERNVNGGQTLYYIAKHLNAKGKSTKNRIKGDIIQYLIDKKHVKRRSYYNPLYYLRPSWLLAKKRKNIKVEINVESQDAKRVPDYKPWKATEEYEVAKKHFTAKTYEQVSTWAKIYQTEYEKYELEQRKKAVREVKERIEEAKDAVRSIFEEKQIENTILEYVNLYKTRNLILYTNEEVSDDYKKIKQTKSSRGKMKNQFRVCMHPEDLWIDQEWNQNRN